MNIRIIQSPYDTARRDVRMGCGPGAFLAQGLVTRLGALGHEVTTTTVDPKPNLPAEIETGFAVMRGVAAAVREAVEAGAFPLVLAGNCNTSVGTVSGLTPRPVGVVWLDAHADFNTPETTSSGFLDGMGLAILAGHCWQPLAQTIPGYVPLGEERILLAGTRDVDEAERKRLAVSQITQLSDQTLTAAEGGQQLGAALDRLADRAEAIHLHIDLDVHDASIAPANHFQPPGGLSPERLQALVALVVERIPVASAYLGAYDPAVDPHGVTLNSGFTLIETIVGSLAA